MEFVALDFETANPCLSSICQIGIVTFDDSGHINVWQTLVNPEDHFAKTNISIHGITEADVQDAPRFPEIYDRLCCILTDQVVVHYTAFDRVAMGRAEEKYDLPVLQCNWLDATDVVRRTWRDIAHSGYNLANVTARLGIQFRHHAADEDARAAGLVLLEALRVTGTKLSDWVNGYPTRVSVPASHDQAHRHESHWVDYPAHCQRTGDSSGPLSGEVLVFTGNLTISREEAADMAAKAGCNVADGVTKKTTMLVVGNQDVRLLAGHEKSSKHRKAEELIEKGQMIRILSERDFRRLLGKEQVPQ